MGFLKLVRACLLLIAFLVFAYQMIFAMKRYLSYDITHTYVVKTIDEVPMPLLLFCQRDQYDWDAAERNGYKWRHLLYKGVLGAGISWGGKNNQSFEEVFRDIYKYEYDSVSFSRQTRLMDNAMPFLVNTTDREITFVYPHGYCINFKDMPSLKQFIARFNPQQSFDMIATDPGRRSFYAVAESSFTGEKF